ncbi:MAG: FAD-binding oxidoreductase [Acidobacteria bacterium]|nr:FAD-binding oxidoreductase [Acidobacteriota bacterium]MCG3194386.1 Decaprenylphosphoryl-beta-D-ribose oxidase [Thermoanaerobaculia bacterium]MCK6681082.1 FAD-binding oxidoreductase [Thermoanaerobaculia bacterium]
MTALELVQGFGLYNFSLSDVHRPRTVEEVQALVARFKSEGRPYVCRGAGRSYGPVATHPGGAVIDFSLLNNAVSLDAESGVMKLQAGATIGDLWRYAVPRGFWPPVVPGTMFVTMGGAVSANIHGKNHYKRGSFCEHLEAITAAGPGGELIRIPKDDPRLEEFVAAYGARGPIVEIELGMKRIETGYFDVEGFTLPSLSETLAAFESGKETWEYQVAWIDCYPSGADLGRSAVHVANHTPAGEIPAGKGFDLADQEVPGTIAGIVPKGLLAQVLALFTFDLGMHAVNTGKFWAGKLLGHTRYRQPLVHFNFLLDSIPDWRRAYRPLGFIQYQIFVPKERGLDVLTEAIKLQHRLGVVSYLGVLKRHRADRFRNAYTPEGYSLALDFPVTRSNSAALIQLCRTYDRLVAEAGGKVYRAKDCVGSFERSQEFLALRT